MIFLLHRSVRLQCAESSPIAIALYSPYGHTNRSSFPFGKTNRFFTLGKKQSFSDYFWKKTNRSFLPLGRTDRSLLIFEKKPSSFTFGKTIAFHSPLPKKFTLHSPFQKTTLRSPLGKTIGIHLPLKKNHSSFTLAKTNRSSVPFGKKITLLSLLGKCNHSSFTYGKPIALPSPLRKTTNHSFIHLYQKKPDHFNHISKKPIILHSPLEKMNYSSVTFGKKQSLLIRLFGEKIALQSPLGGKTACGGKKRIIDQDRSESKS